MGDFPPLRPFPYTLLFGRMPQFGISEEEEEEFRGERGGSHRMGGSPTRLEKMKTEYKKLF